MTQILMLSHVQGDVGLQFGILSLEQAQIWSYHLIPGLYETAFPRHSLRADFKALRNDSNSSALCI